MAVLAIVGIAVGVSSSGSTGSSHSTGTTSTGTTSFGVAPATHTITGTMTVQTIVTNEGCGHYGASATDNLSHLDAITAGQSFPCSDGPGGGYSDIRDGTTVSVSDGSGKLVATGSLEGGTESIHGVVFTFNIPNVPDYDFYKIETSHRGEVPFSRTELEGDNWTADLTLGHWND